MPRRRRSDTHELPKGPVVARNRAGPGGLGGGRQDPFWAGPGADDDVIVTPYGRMSVREFWKLWEDEHGHQ